MARLFGLALLLLTVRVDCRQGATTSRSAENECMTMAPRTYSRNHRQRLCHNVHSFAAATAAVECVKAAGKSLSVDWTIKLCSGGKAGREGGQCVVEASKLGTRPLPPEFRVQLCETAPKGNAVGPALCSQAVHKLRDRDWLHTPQVRTALCRGAEGEAPAHCVASLPRSSSSSLSQETITKLCARVPENSGSGDCAAAAMKLPLNLRPAQEDLVTLCAHAPGPSSRSVEAVNCLRRSPSNWDLSDRARLCSMAEDVKPAACASSIKGKWTMAATLELCSHRPSDTTPTSPHSSPSSQSIHSTPALDSGEETVGPMSPEAAVICANSAPPSFSMESKLKLCRPPNLSPTHTGSSHKSSQAMHATREEPVYGAASAAGGGGGGLMTAAERGKGPVSCVRTTGLGGLSEDDKVALCENALNPSPAKCFAAAPYTMQTGHKVALCRGSTDSSPGECASIVRQVPLGGTVPHASRVDDDLIVDLCYGSQSSLSLSPAACFAASPDALSPELRVALCLDADDIKPALCAHHGFFNWNHPSSSHTGSQSADSPSSTNDTAVTGSITADSGSISTGSSTGSSDGDRSSMDPASMDGMRREGAKVRESAEGLTQGQNQNSNQNQMLMGQSLGHSVRPSTIVSLCHGASGSQSNGTVECAFAALSRGLQLSEDQILALCHGTSDRSPVDCVGAAPYRLSMDERIEVCQGATSATPGACASAVSAEYISAHKTIALCKGATSMTPAHCLREAASSDEADIHRCRNVKAVPAELHIEALHHHPPSPFAADTSMDATTPGSGATTRAGAGSGDGDGAGGGSGVGADYGAGAGGGAGAGAEVSNSRGSSMNGIGSETTPSRTAGAGDGVSDYGAGVGGQGELGSAGGMEDGRVREQHPRPGRDNQREAGEMISVEALVVDQFHQPLPLDDKTLLDLTVHGLASSGAGAGGGEGAGGAGAEGGGKDAVAAERLSFFGDIIGFSNGTVLFQSLRVPHSGGGNQTLLFSVGGSVLGAAKVLLSAPWRAGKSLSQTLRPSSLRSQLLMAQHQHQSSIRPLSESEEAQLKEAYGKRSQSDPIIPEVLDNLLGATFAALVFLSLGIGAARLLSSFTFSAGPGGSVLMRRKTKAEREEEADNAKRAAVAERMAAAEADPLFKGASKRQKRFILGAS